MTKNPCYIYWDDSTVPETERKVYIQCESCFGINKKGIRWPCNNLYGKKTIKCNLCDTIIYERKKKKKNEQNLNNTNS